MPAGVATGKRVLELLRHASDNHYAIPAVNVVSSSSVNSCLEAAKKVNSPIIIQISNGGAQFFAGKGMKNKNQAAAVAGSVACALHVRAMAKHYGVEVVLHSDHCAKKLLPWFDGMLAADEAYFAKTGEPLFSSHMLDLSEEPLGYIIDTCERYLKRMVKINCLLETELGLTGGEEDGVDHSGADNSRFYTQPGEIYECWKRLTKISPAVTIAAAFGNVHGVYKPGNVQLRPEILLTAQKYIAKAEGLHGRLPVFFVFHGGSGSEKDKIAQSLKNGVVKMNIDTDTQWAYWNGVRKYEAKSRDFMQGQIGNPKGKDQPNKKFYDPRKWLRKAEDSMVGRLEEAFRDLNCLNRSLLSKL